MRIAAWAAALIVFAGGIAVYAPETVQRLSPTAGAWLLQARHWAFPATATGGATPAPAVATANAPQPISVAAEPVRRTDFPIVIEGLGQVQGYRNVTVRARVDGQILKIGFVEGRNIAAGDLIAQIDPRPFQAVLDQANAKQQQDEANLANARLDLQRYSTLAKQSFATQQQLDTQNALVNQLVAALASDAAAIEAAQAQLDYTTIRAPIAGRAGLRLADEGNLVSASQQTGVATIAQLEPIAVLFAVPEQDVGRIGKALADGAPPVVVKATNGETLAAGRLVTTENQVDPNTGTLRLKAEFANADHALWPGLAVSAALTVGVDKEALTVPTAAVQHGQQGLYVYIVDAQSRAALRKVTVSRQNTQVAVIANGLQEGDRVVTTNLLLLQPGTPIRVEPASSGS